MRLLETYEASLAEAALADWPGVLNLATETASGHAGAHCLMNLPMLLLDVIYKERSRTCIPACAQRCSLGHLSYGARRRPANPRTHPRRPALEI
jgi:hypothetical protein